MNKLEYAWWCFVLSLILGACWGGLIYWFSPMAGLSIGLSLFLFCFVILWNIGKVEFLDDLILEEEQLNDV